VLACQVAYCFPLELRQRDQAVPLSQLQETARLAVEPSHWQQGTVIKLAAQ
tara:strand:+ start:469 stop:621 length:153 start_codon:yes stop_codon:yes gene_type:complete